MLKHSINSRCNITGLKPTRCYQDGFSLIEVLLAVVIIIIVGIGSYGVFTSGVNNNNLNTASDEMVEIANVYSDLVSAGLTSNISDGDGLITLLKNSDRLSSNYFSSADDSDTDSDDTDTTVLTTMVNSFGELIFTSATPYSFSVTVPLSSSGNPGQLFCQQLSDVYNSCEATAADSDSGESASAALSYDYTSSTG